MTSRRARIINRSQDRSARYLDNWYRRMIADYQRASSGPIVHLTDEEGVALRSAWDRARPRRRSWWRRFFSS